MKIFKKLLASILCIAMVVSFAGCSSDEIKITPGMTYREYLEKYEQAYVDEFNALMDELDNIETEMYELMDGDFDKAFDEAYDLYLDAWIMDDFDTLAPEDFVAYDEARSAMSSLMRELGDAYDSIASLSPETEIGQSFHDEYMKSWAEPGSGVMEILAKAYDNLDFMVIIQEQEADTFDVFWEIYDEVFDAALDLINIELDKDLSVIMLDVEVEE